MGLKARDYLTTDVVAVGRAANVAEIAALLKKHRIPGVPVVDGDKRLLGLVTHEELINIFIPHYLSMFDELAFLDDLGEISTSIMKVAALLINRKLVLIPVVDEDGRVVGVVSRNDVSFALTGAASEES